MTMPEPAPARARQFAAAPGSAVPRVAICSDGEIWGGVERFIECLAVGLRDAGCDPVLVLFHDALLAARLRAAGFQPVVLPHLRNYGLAQVAHVRQVLRDHRITVLHVHGYRAMVVGGMAAVGTPTRVLRTVHGLLEPLDGWRHVVGYTRLAVNRMLERVAARATRAETVFVARYTAAAYGGRGSRGRVITNGLDLSDLPAQPSRANRPGFHVGIVGRISKVKGHEYLLDAMRYLRHLPDLHLHVFGCGPLQERCEARVRQEHLSRRVTFHGFCADVTERMRGLDVLTIPSLHEGLPYTLLEAMYLRVPVVASAVGGLAEVITDGRHGLLVPPANARRLAAALERLYHDRGTCRALGEAGRALVRERYQATRMTDEYLHLYTTMNTENR